MGTRRAKQNLALLFCLLSAGAVYGETYKVSDLSLGVYDTVPGNMTPSGSALSITNFHVDPYSKGLIQRDGSTRQNSSQLSGSSEVDVFTYVQQDADEYLIAFASKTVAYSTNNGSSWTTLISTGVDGAYWDCSGFIDDKEYCVTQSTSAFSFNGTVHAVVSAMPAAKYLENYENRLWAGNTAANPGRLYFSDLLSGTAWTTSTNYLDFDEPITGLGVINDGLAVYTDNSVFMVRGDDPTNFSVRKISRGIGCANNRTIKNMMLKGTEVQVFFSKGYQQTKNNFYANNGIEVVPIGNSYLNTTAGINVGNSSIRSKEWDTQTDFNAGTLSNTFAHSDGYVRLSTSNDSVSDRDFELGGTGYWDVVTGQITSNSSYGTPQSGSYFYTTYDVASPTDWGGSIVYRVYVIDGNGADHLALTYTLTGTHEQKTIPLSSYVGQRIKLRFVGTDGATDYTFFRSASYFVGNGSDITFYGKNETISSKVQVIIDQLGSGGVTTIASGTATSEVYQTDSSLSEWSTFEIEQSLNSGTISYEVRTAATSGGVASAAYRSISDGVVIATTTDQFIQWRATISSGTATDITDININKVTINWISSTGASHQPDAEVFEESYWFTYPGPSESRNQSVLVINKEGAAYNLEYGTSSQNGFYGLTVSKGSLYAGDSSTNAVNGGYVWQLETGNLDNGQAVTASVQFKHEEFGLDDFEKSLQNIYVNYGVQTSGNFTATIQKNFSESSLDYTIPLSSGTTINRYKIEPDQQTTGKQIGLKFTNSTSGQKLKLYPPLTYTFEKVRAIRQQN